METSLQGLVQQREELKKQIIDLEKQIARHPDTIRSYFHAFEGWDNSVVEALAAKVTFMKPVHGNTESRKNPIPWHGHVFEIDGKVYRVYKGSNWCSDVFEGGVLDKEEGLCHSTLDGMYSPKVTDPIAYLMSEGVTEEWKQVAYLVTEN